MSGDCGLFRENLPSLFWKTLDGHPAASDWFPAAWLSAQVLDSLDALSEDHPVDRIAPHCLGEAQFGASHWQLSRLNRLYYGLRPFLPHQIRPILRRISAVRKDNGHFTLNWPIEDRYVRFQFDTVAHMMMSNRLNTLKYIHFWPHGKRFALVLSHDVESSEGQSFVRDVVALEERFGFRSSFNFVPEAYRVDRSLLAELRQRGFEVGLHGLKHDGKLFSSRKTFEERAAKINRYIKEWDVAGFRSPLTHRHPEWMQVLDIEYDSSFFDTDPYETIPGGTMSIWPFVMGRFIELPYTLAQDHTLMETLGETTPRIWLEKAEFVREYCGMALLNSHPDYLRDAKRMNIYREFLETMSQSVDYWQALPRDVARWWWQRAALDTADIDEANVSAYLSGASVGEIRLSQNKSGAARIEL